MTMFFVCCVMCRSCTDVICLVLFIIFVLVFVGVGLWGKYRPVALKRECVCSWFDSLISWLPFVKRFALSIGPLSACPVLSVCNVGVLWPNGLMDHDETWHAGRPWPQPRYVRWRPSSRPKNWHGPQFSAHVRCHQMTGWIKMPLGMEVGLFPKDFVRWGHSTLPKRTQPPIFGPCPLWPNGWMD